MFLNRFLNWNKMIDTVEDLVRLQEENETLKERLRDLETKLAAVTGGSSKAGMERVKVESSLLAYIGYDSSQQVLEIEFKKGKIHHYYDVPPEVFLKLQLSRSKGRFYLSKIDKQYKFSTVKRKKRILSFF